MLPAGLPEDAVELGRVRDAWGVRGALKILPYSASPEALFSCRCWHALLPDGNVQPLHITQVRAAGSGDLVASVQGVQDRDAALALKGARLFVPRADFPALPEGEYYWVDLIGLRVINREGVELGEVRDVMDNGAQAVLIVRAIEHGKERERLIPFVGVYIDEVRLDAGTIAVDWQPDY